MFLLKTILKIIFILKLVKADLLLCDNNKCKHADLISMDALLMELDAIKEGNRNTTTLLKELNESIDHKFAMISKEIEIIKSTHYEKADKFMQAPTTYTGIATATANATESDRKRSDNDTEINNSLYDNMWIVIQRRQDGSVDFFRNWTEYKEGFGDPFGEFFVGLDKIYNLTNYRDHELLIILEDFDGNIRYAHYDEFLIGNETHRYILLKLGKYYGTAGDHLRLHKNRLFSTKDRDNDEADNGNCAQWFKGAWWYYHCLTSNLNGPYRHSRYLNDADRGIGITWGSWDEIKHSYKTVQMMLRAKEKKGEKINT